MQVIHREASLAGLVAGAAGGDADSWTALVQTFTSTVDGIARKHRLSEADTADVSQNTWLRLVEHLHRIEHPERLGAWLATTARRECLHLLRMSGRQIPNGDDFDGLPHPMSSASMDVDLAAAELRQVVASLIEQLPSRSKRLFQLLSTDVTLSYVEISEALSMPVGSIGPTRARALEQLRGLALRNGIHSMDVLL